MLNQGNVLPTAKKHGETHDGIVSTVTQSLEDFSVKGKSPDNVNVRPIGDAPGPRANPKRTLLPESDAALAEYASIAVAKLSQGVFTHEQNVDLPQEGFNDPANEKV